MIRSILYVLALAAWVAIFWADFPVVVGFWNGGDYSHCYLIIPIIIYLVWTNRSKIVESVGGSSFFGIVLLLVSVLFLFIGRFGSLRFFISLSMWVSFCGIAMTALGQRSFRTLWMPMLIGLFMVPLPAFLNRIASFRLRLISSYLSEKILHLLNIPVFRDGNLIDLGVIQLQVVDACSGLRYLWPSILMALLVGWFYLKRPWKRIVLLLLSIPVTIFSNAFRIALTGVLTKYIDPKLAEGFFHEFSGWLVYVLSLVLLWGGTRLLASSADRVREETTPVDWSRFGNKVPGAPSGVLVLALMAVLAFGPYFLQQQQYIPERQNFDSFPTEVAHWHAEYSRLSSPVLESLGLNDYVNGIFTSKQVPGNIWVLVSWYSHQTVEHAAHAPTSCLLGSGWDLLRKQVLPPESSGRSFPVTQMVLGKDEHRLVSNFWLLQRGRVVTSEWLNKWYLVRDALMRQRTDGALVRIEMQIPPGMTVDQVQGVLNTFAAALQKDLRPHLPEDYGKVQN